MPRDAYVQLIDYLRETTTLQSCLRVLTWDQETYMPPGGAEIRARQVALLAGMIHRRRNARELGDLIDAAGGQEAGTPAASNLREARREHASAVKVPAELIEERARTTTLARGVWAEARAKRDFSLFRPWLEKVVDISRRQAEALGYEEHPYDALLDIYEPGETTAGIEELFAPLREALADLLGRILGSGRETDVGILRRSYPVADQESIGRRAVALLGFDFERGRLDVTTHPFCSGTGPDDVRLTTRYDEGYFNDSFFSLLHEAGHGIYEQGLRMEAFGTPMGQAASYGIHESQSRLWENFVGRSRGFLRHFYPAIQQAFPDALGAVEREDFYRAVNDVRPSFVRVDADEVTYNLHVFLRAGLERAMLAGDLAVADLPGAWNEAFERDFRLTPPDHAQGCLQDIHWSMGSFGYFPTYALGNIYAAQIWNRAREELGDLEEQFARGGFATLKTWLNQRIHAQGKRYPPRDLLEQVTGAAPAPGPLVEHLEAKYSEIYGL